MTMTWQPIKTAPKDGKLWEVSINGIIRVNNKIKKSHLSSKGYEKICIGNKTIFVHRIIAMTFVSNPNNFIEVNHKNGIKTDNRADNLEWCTRSQNMKHAYKLGLHKGVILKGRDSPNWKRNGDKHSQSIAIRGISITGKVIEYRSYGLAAKDGFSPSHISSCINGKRKQHKGYRWMPLPAKPTI